MNKADLNTPEKRLFCSSIDSEPSNCKHRRKGRAGIREVLHGKTKRGTRRRSHARTLQNSISTMQSVLVGVTQSSSTGTTSKPRNPMRQSAHVNLLGLVPVGAKLSSALVLRRDSTLLGCSRNSPTSQPEMPAGSRTLSRRLAARRPPSLPGVTWPASASPLPPLDSAT